MTGRLVETGRELRGGAPLVAVVEPAELRQRDDLGIAGATSLRRTVRGRGLHEAEVRTVIMVVRDVASEQAAQV